MRGLNWVSCYFCLILSQVNSMLDIGLPLFGQLQKVKGTVNANSEISADKPHQPAVGFFILLVFFLILTRRFS